MLIDYFSPYLNLYFCQTTTLSWIFRYCTKTFIGHTEWIRSVRPSPEGNLLASCSNDHTIRIWSVESRECQVVLRGHEHVVECITWASHPQSILAITSSASEGGDSTNFTNDGFINATTNGIPVDLNSLPSSMNSSLLLVSGSRDRTIRFWDVNIGICLFVLVSSFYTVFWYFCFVYFVLTGDSLIVTNASSLTGIYQVCYISVIHNYVWLAILNHSWRKYTSCCIGFPIQYFLENDVKFINLEHLNILTTVTRLQCNILLMTF